MSSQNDITVRVTQTNGNYNFCVDKGVAVSEKDYASFIASYFDFQAKIETEKQKTLQEKEKTIQNKHKFFWIIAFAAGLIVGLLLYATLSSFTENSKINADKEIRIEKMRLEAEANKTK